MGFELNTYDYLECIKKAYEFIHENQEYITNLDLATGDGDHWSNMNMGFQKIVLDYDNLITKNISELLKQIGRNMMATIGGSSGVLYGSAYIAASKVVADKEIIEKNTLYTILETMLKAIMERGQAQEGFKTMIDSLAPAVRVYKECLDKKVDDIELCEKVKKAAIDGAENTKNMEAVKGRATYQSNKGIGHLDPGAVTMSYQIMALMDYIKEKINQK